MALTVRQSYLLGTTPEAARTVAPAILRKRVMTSQPQYAAQIDWGNPITRGLVTAINFAAGSPDAVRGATYSLAGSAKRLANKGMIGIGGFSTTSDYIALPNISGYLGNRFTVATIQANGTASNQGYGDLSTDGQTEHYPYAGVLYVTGASGARGPVSVGSFDLLKPHSLIIEVDANGIGNSARIYFSGKSTADGTFTPAGAGNFWNPSAALGSGGGFVYSGVFYGLFAWNRQLSGVEAKSLSDNPWQIFLAPNAQPWVATP